MLYSGKSADGSDIKEVKGVATISPCGKFWTTEDLTKMKRRERREYWRNFVKEIKL